MNRDKLEKQRSAAETERSSFISHYREISEYVQPRLGRFSVTDVNKGAKRHQSIINSTGTRALRVATSGMFAGTMSPSRPWFALETQDREMMRFEPVKLWLYNVEEVMRAIFNASNLYSMAPTMIEELLAFATGCMAQVDDFDTVARFYTYPAGSYCIAQDQDYRVDTLIRKFTKTTKQIVHEFGLENVSYPVKRSWDNGGYYDQWEVVHTIMPNEDFDPGKKASDKKRWVSIYYQPDNSDREKLLRKKGFDACPFYAPRWAVTGEDTYGTNCPGMIALGDIKGLQVMERRKAQAVDKLVNPPLTGPGSLRNTTVSAIPGGVTLYEGDENNKLRALYEVKPDIQAISADLNRQELRIKETFFNDLFRAITDMQGIQPKNQLELTERKQEALLELGPVLERFQGELLSPVIDRTFAQAMRAGILPPAPREIEGQVLNINYISTLAMAQRSVATGNIDRIAGFVTGLASAGLPQALDKLDVDDMVDEYARLTNTPPKIINSTEAVAGMREQRAKQQQAMQAAEMGTAAADIAGKLAGAKTGDDSVLTAMAGGKAQQQ